MTDADLDQQERTFPLDLAFCDRCSLVQITETVPPDQLFTEYLYFSSYSETMLKHAATLAKRLVHERRLGPGSLVIEIASNDGYLLTNYANAAIPVLGIEPARNVARAAIDRGVPTICEFFGEELGRRLGAQGQLADVVHANNVLAHVPDLNGFMSGLASILKPDGIAVIEVPYVKDLLDQVEFDTIYHEHLCYFSASAIEILTQRHGLALRDVERLTIHGGSLRLFITRADAAGEATPALQALLADEISWGVRSPAPYQRFAAAVRKVTEDLVNLLTRLRREGKRMAAYGAAAKGSTLLNFAGIGKDMIQFVVDRSPHKQGRYMPGVRLPISPPQRLIDERPDYVLLLTWNFADEILAQQQEYRQLGGRFIVPLPELTIV